MSRPLRLALIVLGILMILAVIVLSAGPNVLPMPESSVSDPRSPMPAIEQMDDMKPDLASLSDSRARNLLGMQMPEFQGITAWWNTPGNQPLTTQDLKGRVVLVKFWTYSCINCIRTFPYVKHWYDRFGPAPQTGAPPRGGFELVGVHTPEFAFEAVPANVEREIQKNGFRFPVALDPDYATWNAYQNHFWPAEYLFDATGKLRYVHYGEGQYDEMERAIAQLLDEAGMTVAAPEEPMPGDVTNFSQIKTDETYFGYQRGSGFANALEVVPEQDANFTLKDVGRNQWSVGGRWRLEGERAVAFGPSAVHRFNVQAPIYNIVLDAPEGTTAKIRVTIDGANPTADMTTDDLVIGADGTATIDVSDPRLYRILTIPDAGRHTIEIEILEGDVRFYAATFG